MMCKDTTFSQISASGLALARQAVGMGEVVFHSCLRNAVEVVVDDEISLV